MTISSNDNPKSDFHRHADQISALHLSILQLSGMTESTVRDAAFRGGPLPAPLHEYVEKIRGTTSYRITDDDIKKLLGAGYSQDAIFEITVAAALGAATERLALGLTALKGVG
jgi:hypothetical protein